MTDPNTQRSNGGIGYEGQSRRHYIAGVSGLLAFQLGSLGSLQSGEYPKSGETVEWTKVPKRYGADGTVDYMTVPRVWVNHVNRTSTLVDELVSEYRDQSWYQFAGYHPTNLKLVRASDKDYFQWGLHVYAYDTAKAEAELPDSLEGTLT